jgi:hypothetical protein
LKKSSLLFALTSALASTAIAWAAPPTTPTPTHAWIGVWEMKSPGKPGLTITLVDDTGGLTGTIVFEVWDRQTEQRIAIEPRAIVNPHMKGDTLAFQVLRIAKPHLKDDPNPSQVEPPDPIDMTLSTPSSGKATLTCPKCGENFTTELERLH